MTYFVAISITRKARALLHKQAKARGMKFYAYMDEVAGVKDHDRQD